MLYYAFIYSNEIWRLEIEAYNEKEAFEIARDITRLVGYSDDEIIITTIEKYLVI